MLVSQIALVLLLYGCEIIRGIMDYQSPSQSKNSTASLSLSDIWEDLIVPIPSVEALQHFQKITLNDEEINQLILLYEQTNDPDLRHLIITRIPLSQGYNEDWLKSIIESDDKPLAALAFNKLIRMELARDSNNDDQWTNWQWSPYVLSLFEKAVEEDFHLLGNLEMLELFQLANRYPDSKFTQGCKEYASLIGEETYFDPKLDLGNNKAPVFKQPFNPLRELEIWPEFIKKYQDHPGVNDAMYRLARAYEMKKDYENALIWYQKSFHHINNDYFSLVAPSRILFIVDMLMNSESIDNFVETHPENSLVPILAYSKAIHLFREDKLLEAINELERFILSYKEKRIKGHLSHLTGGFLGKVFFEDIENQLRNIEDINKIRNSNDSNDVKLYKEAAFMFKNEGLFYNYLWGTGAKSINYRLPGFFGTFKIFVPNWKGQQTVLQASINFDFIEESQSGYQKTNELLRSLDLFKKLVLDYPDSKKREKAAFSIGLIYYFLHNENWTVPLNQKESWAKLGIKSFQNFVDEFPRSSMADDALLSIVTLTDDLQLQAQTLRRIINDYPRGDRRREAEAMMKRHLQNRNREG